uniref:Proteasome subunit beta type-4 n=2 Tax=Canis lupus familiaris TaxID=9615 RepID=A0A8P0PSK6_CANLF
MEAFLESRSRVWAGGPAPGQFYHIPPSSVASVEPAFSPYGGPVTRTQNPMVTGTSVLGVKFEGGVVIAADMLGSYGSLARFRNISRIMRVNDSTMLGASGDYADFQYLKQVLGQMVIDEELLGDGHSYSPRAIHSWLTRAMYSRRSKMNPLWNTMVIGGYADGESFLGYVDMLGVAYEAPSLATGYGAYLAQVRAGEVWGRQWGLVSLVLLLKFQCEDRLRSLLLADSFLCSLKAVCVGTYILLIKWCVRFSRHVQREMPYNLPFRLVLAQVSRIHSGEAVGRMSFYAAFYFVNLGQMGIQPLVISRVLPISLASAARSSGEAASPEPD